MKREEYFACVKEIIARNMNIDKNDLSEETKFYTELKMSSMDAVDVAVEIEDSLGVAVNDESLMGFRTIGDVIAYLVEHHEQDRCVLR